MDELELILAEVFVMSRINQTNLKQDSCVLLVLCPGKKYVVDLNGCVSWDPSPFYGVQMGRKMLGLVHNRAACN